MAKRQYNKKPSKSQDVLIQIERDILYRAKQSQSTWRDALTIAENTTNPRRSELLRLFKDVVLDNHLSALIDLKRDKILSMNFSINNLDGTTDEETTALFNRKWFQDLITAWVDTIFYGHSLLQITQVTPNVNIDIDLVPRENVRPEFQEYATNYWDVRGTSYASESMYQWLIEIGGKRDLGLLVKIAPLVLWKKYAMMFWAEYQELFGTPIRVVKTKSQKPEDRAVIENFLKTMGSSGYGVMNDSDTLDLVSSQTSDAYEVYDKFINRINSELSKLIIGSTDSVDGESGSFARAKVHNEQSELKTQSDLRNLKYFINNVAIPKLQKLDFLPENIEFTFDDSENITLDEKSIIDERLVKIIASGTFEKEYLENRYDVKLADNIPSNE